MINWARAIGKNDYCLRVFLKSCYEQKSAEYHAPDYVVMSRKRYEQLTEKERPRIKGVYMDEAGYLKEDSK